MFGWDFIDNDNFEGQRSNVLKYPWDDLIQPPGKSIHYELYWNNPCSTRNRVNVARGTEVDIRWLKVN